MSTEKQLVLILLQIISVFHYDACMISVERQRDSVEPSEIQIHNVHAVKRSKVYEKKFLETMKLVGNPYP